ncbi:MAG: glutamate--tRNA ligase [Parcubacteria bacterium C7867-005]|nr:MAG: glutamate--tRNA ligase [Parcubacteria bacterium C7867-005]
MIDPNKKIVVRMAPSPTGNLHVGTARTTLFNYLFAKKYGGKFILRIEDTDKERSTKEFEKNILDGLSWLGLTCDEFFRQSERTEVYKNYVQKMLDNGTAYISKEEPQEEGQRSEVVRFKNPNKKIKFDDLIRGEVEFDTTELKDFVIAKSPEEPLYHLAVVVDDHEMGVTHVIRGEDHISNTPRQILIQEAIGANRPIYAHLPLILDADRKKLSKRKHGEAVWVEYYKNQGYLSDALLNFYALLGWNPGTEKEIFSLSELVEAFDIDKVQKGGAIFDEKKLRWINREHLKMLPKEELSSVVTQKILEKFPDVSVPEKIVDLILERIDILSDIDILIADGEIDYVFMEPDLNLEKIIWKNSTKEKTLEHLKHVVKMVGNKDGIMKYAEEVGKGDVLWPLRYALSGREKSPDPFTLMSLLGQDKTEKRIEKAIKLLE